MAQDEQNGAMACAEQASNKVMDIKERMETLLAKAMGVKQELETKIQQCVDENSSSVIGLVSCLKKEVLPIVQEVVQMEKDIAKLIADAQKVIPGAVEELNTCMTQLSEDLAVRQQAIVSDIKKCLVGQ